MAKKLEGLKVAVLAADGFEQLELTSPLKELQRQGAQVEVISLRPGKIQGMNALLPGKKVPVDRLVHNAEPAAYDALLLPGGFVSPDLLRQSEAARGFVRAMDAAGKPIAVICHGPWLLVSAGLVRGRRLTSWPGIKDDIENAGGEWWDKPVVRDGNWVSSRGPQDLRKFNKAMVELLARRTAQAPEAGAPAARRILAPARWLAGVAALAAGGVAVARLAQRGRRALGSMAATEEAV
ncbi:MAG TPA: type 1 glutamine amidotransferase domain-containing protein [Roseiflexaceae bacterium]|nr:type 1 glutamine amidotransferase domain-containing protein [Roseiflexaceae bacterium]